MVGVIEVEGVDVGVAKLEFGVVVEVRCRGLQLGLEVGGRDWVVVREVEARIASIGWRLKWVSKDSWESMLRGDSRSEEEDMVGALGLRRWGGRRV